MNNEELPDYKKQFLQEMEVLRQQQLQEQAQQSPSILAQRQAQKYFLLDQQTNHREQHHQHRNVQWKQLEAAAEWQFIRPQPRCEPSLAEFVGEPLDREKATQHPANCHFLVLQRNAQQDCFHQPQVHFLLIHHPFEIEYSLQRIQVFWGRVDLLFRGSFEKVFLSQLMLSCKSGLIVIHQFYYMLENVDFYTLIQTEFSVPLKQKVFNFHQQFNGKRYKPRHKNYSTLGFNPESQKQIQKNHFALRPKLPSKRLLNQPRFFMSLERKRGRLIEDLKNVVRFQQQSSTATSLKGPRPKNYSLNQSKYETFRLSKSRIYEQRGSLAKQTKNKSAFQNYNMQLLMRKRNLMASALKSSRETIDVFNKDSN